VLQLLTGPAGSGKTSLVLDAFRRAIERDASRVRLLTPTATMAEHIRNKMAREDFVFRPGLVLTLSKFTGEWSERPRVSGPALYLAVERAIDRLKLPAFARVAGMPGFSSLVARTIEEFSAAGISARNLPVEGTLQEALRCVFEAVEGDIRRRGQELQSTRMELAGERIRRDGLGDVRTIWMDGFFSLTDPELSVVAAISEHADVLVTLPDYTTSAETHERLLAL
jgi:ATP-dependent helicase/DNAse subunit B